MDPLREHEAKYGHESIRRLGTAIQRDPASMTDEEVRTEMSRVGIVPNIQRDRMGVMRKRRMMRATRAGVRL